MLQGHTTSMKVPTKFLQSQCFSCLSLVSIQFDMISVVHTGGYAVIQVKHRRDVNLRLSVYF